MVFLFAINACNDYNAIPSQQSMAIMGSMTIRDLDDQLKQRLRVRAANNNRSMEEEVRAILKAAVYAESAKQKSLVKAIRARIEPLGGVEIKIAPREPIREIKLD